MKTDAEIGAAVKEAREYIGMSQDTAAKALGLARASLSAIENGKRKLTATELSQVSRLYCVRPEVLIGEGVESEEDETTTSILRTSKKLGAKDREQLLRFAEFLRNAGDPTDDGERD